VIIESSGAQITIPEGAEGAVATDNIYSVTRMTGGFLAGWPQGTAVGFTFEPAGQKFRIPVLIELPSHGGRAEAMCESATGERTTLPPDAAEKDHYHFHST